MDPQFELGVKHLAYNYKLRKAREKSGLTQEQLAAFCDMPLQTLGRIEGLKQIPTPEMAEKICEVLGLDIDETFPQWLELYKLKKSSYDTHHLITERLLPHMKNIMLTGETIEDIEHKIDSESLKKKMRKAVRTLSDRERKVIELRFGLKDGVPKSYENVGSQFGITRERIRQIEAKALRKLRHPSRSIPLVAYLPFPNKPR